MSEERRSSTATTMVNEGGRDQWTDRWRQTLQVTHSISSGLLFSFFVFDSVAVGVSAMLATRRSQTVTLHSPTRL